MKFQLSCAPRALAPFEKETSVEECGGGLRAAVFFPSSYGSKNGGPEATATVLALSNSKLMGYILFPSQP